jgi:hypothetical protein
VAQEPATLDRRSFPARHAAPLALVGLLAVALAARSVAALAVPAPWIAPDEMVYALLGRGLWEHGRLQILGGATPYYSLLYPALVGLPLKLGGLATGYDALRVVQAFVLCSTAVVTWFWARSLARPWWALAAAAPTLALPGMAYAGELMTDVLFVPLATLAAWAAARALERPTRGRQAALLAALLACALTRLEANVLVLALVPAALVLRRARALLPTWIVLGAGLVVWAAARGASGSSLLGGYDAATGGYDAVRAVEYVAYHAGDALLAAGIVPLCAAVVLALGRPADERLRATLAVGLSLAAATVLEVGVFASGHAGRLTERTLIFVLPPIFVCFAAWLDRGAPRPRGAALAVAGVAVAAVAVLPLARLAVPAAIQDNPTLVPLVHLGGGTARVSAILAAAVGAALFLLVPRRASWVLPVVVAAALAGVSASASAEFVHRSKSLRGQLLGADPGWIQRAANGPVTFLYNGDPYWNLVWAQLYRNPRITGVVTAAGTSVPGPLPQKRLLIVHDDGVLGLVGGGTPTAPLVASWSWVTFRGRPIASNALAGGDAPKLVLWRLSGRPRLDTLTEGMRPNGDVYDSASVTVFDCGKGRLELSAYAKADVSVTLAQGARVLDSRKLANGQPWTATIPTSPANGRMCTFTVTTTGLLGVTRFRWVRG